MPIAVLNPTAEVMYIADNTPTTAYSGGDFTIGERNDQGAIVKRSLIKFDLSSIPDGATIKSAKIRLYMHSDKSSTSATMNIYGVRRAWVQGQASWNNYSTGNAWGTAGAANTTSDIFSTPYGTRAMSASESVGYLDFTLTASDVQDWLDGTVTNNGVLFWSSVESNDGYIYYSDATGSVIQKPELVVEWENTLNPDDWSTPKKITIDNTKVSGGANLSDFPVLVPDEVLGSAVYAGLNPDIEYAIDYELSSSGHSYIADNTALQTQDWTTEAWIKVEQLPSTAGTHMTVIAKYDYTNTDREYLVQFRTTDGLKVYYSLDGAATTNAETLAPFLTSDDVGKWVHVAVSVDVSAKEIKFYKNGHQVPTGAVSGTVTSVRNGASKFVIGANNEGLADFIDAKMCNVRHWSDVRTANEILVNRYETLTGTANNLVGSWYNQDNDHNDNGGTNNLTASGSPVIGTDTPIGGSDLRFTSDLAGNTELPFEIVNIDTSAETSEIWVLLQNVDHNDDTLFYAWYGNTSAVAYSITDTYGRNAVFAGDQARAHLERDTIDSAGNYDGTNNGVTFAAGKIGNDGVFSSDYVEFNNALKRIGNTNCTLSLWFKTSSAAQQFLYGEGNSANAFPLLQFYISGGKVYLALRNDSGSSSASTTPVITGLDDGEWHYAVFTKTTTGYEVFIDGVSDGTMTSSIVPTINRSAFGTLPRSGEGIFLAGNAGELRYNDAVLSDDWIITEFNNQDSPSTFFILAVDTNSEISAKTTGSVDVNSTISAKLTGVDTANGEINAKLTGKLSANSEISAKVTGEDSASSEISAKLSGVASINSEISSRVTGKLPANSEIAAKVTGEDTASSEISAKLIGGINVNGEIQAKTHGVDTIFDQISAKVTGEETAQSEIQAKLSGRDVANSEISAKLIGGINVNSEISAKLHGVDTISSEVNAKLTGKFSSNSEISAKTTGSTDISSEISAKITGSDSITSEVQAKITGTVNQADSEISAKVTGEDTTSSEILGKTTGKISANSEVNAKLKGITTTFSQISSKLVGSLTSFGSIFAKLTGADSSNSEVSAKLTGSIDVNSEISAKLLGEDLASGQISAKLTGSTSASAEVQAKVTGVAGSNSDISAKVSGIDTITSEIQSKITGSLSAFSQIAAKLIGQVLTSSEILAKLTGKLSTNDEVSAKVTGNVQVNSEVSSKIKGLDTAQSEITARVVATVMVNDEISAKLTGEIIFPSGKTVLGTNTSSSILGSSLSDSIVLGENENKTVLGEK